MSTIKKCIAASLAVIFTLSSVFVPLDSVEASINNWKRGVSIHPYTTTHFGTSEMKQTLRDIKDAGANYAILIIPYYQANRESTEMRPSWNTPTDESLISAITYAHSIGLKVMLKPHLETDYIEWRGNINPAPQDRQAWFNSYRDMLVKYGRIAQRHGVEDFCIGTELLKMANPDFDSMNTERWRSVIRDVRSVYDGELTYSSNWDNELDKIEFWDDLDYVGISAYYNLYHAQNSSPEELRKSWDAWRSGVIEPTQQRLNKPIMFTELGYRSIHGSHINPWDWSRQEGFNETDQANAYEALFSYWDDYPWMIGVGLWKWEVNPNAGGQGDTDYTPQNKMAETIISRWWSGSGEPTPEPEPEPDPDPDDNNEPTPQPEPEPDDDTEPDPEPDSGNPTFTANSDDTDTYVDSGIERTFELSVHNSGERTTGAIIDLEVYRDDGSRVKQTFFENQTFDAGETKDYTVSFTPTDGNAYRIAVGAFNSDWTENYYWGNEIMKITQADQEPDPAPEPEPKPDPEPEPDPEAPTPESQPLDILSPRDQANMTGVQTFEAKLGDANINEYKMYWQVDGDRLNEMENSTEGEPHKRAWVGFDGWTWNGNGPYTINFVAKDLNGSIIKERSVQITTN